MIFFLRASVFLSRSCMTWDIFIVQSISSGSVAKCMLILYAQGFLLWWWLWFVSFSFSPSSFLDCRKQEAWSPWWPMLVPLHVLGNRDYCKSRQEQWTSSFPHAPLLPTMKAFNISILICQVPNVPLQECSKVTCILWLQHDSKRDTEPLYQDWTSFSSLRQLSARISVSH